MRIVRQIDPMRSHGTSHDAIDATIPLVVLSMAHIICCVFQLAAVLERLPSFLLATVRSLARRIAGLGAHGSNGRAPVVAVRQLRAFILDGPDDSLSKLSKLI